MLKSKLASVKLVRCKVVPLSVETDTGGAGVGKQLKGQSGGFAKDNRDFSI